jgi:hypothetical protein
VRSRAGLEVFEKRKPFAPTGIRNRIAMLIRLLFITVKHIYIYIYAWWENAMFFSGEAVGTVKVKVKQSHYRPG